MSTALTIIGIAFGLAMDAFAVAIAVGLALGRPSGRQFFRLAFHFGFFQFMMPIVGWGAGELSRSLIESFDHLLAFGLLAYIGAKMIWAGLHHDGDRVEGDPTKGMSLVVLSVATSIDAMAVGLSLSVMEIGIWVPCVVIGLFAAGMTILGMMLGRVGKVGTGRYAQIAGGLVLAGIGVKILASHLAG